MNKEMKLNELDLMEIQDEFEKSGIDFNINEYREEENAEVAADLVKYDITSEEYDEVSRVLDLYAEGTDINDIFVMLRKMKKGQQECWRDYARTLNTVWEEDWCGSVKEYIDNPTDESLENAASALADRVIDRMTVNN